MSEKIKVGNAEVEKANYDYYLLQYSKMPKEYVIADLVSKCEDYQRLFSLYQDLEIKLLQKDNIIKEVREYIKENSCESEVNLYGIPKYLVFKGSVEKILEILDKERL